MKLRLVVLACLLVVVVTACAPPPELRNDAYLRDTSLIDGEPCGAPCWRGITPGETSWRAARTILEDDPTLADINIRTEENTSEVAATFRRVDGEPCCLIYSETGEQVDQLLLQLAPVMRLRQVIETHGEPEYLSLSEVSDDQAAAALYYPELRAIVYAFVAGAAQGTINPDSEIFALLYVRQSDVDLVIRNSALYRWAGYAAYSEYAGRAPDITPAPTTDPAEIPAPESVPTAATPES